MSTLKFEDWLSFEDKQIQPITETQQIILFEALAKEGKAWDSENGYIGKDGHYYCVYANWNYCIPYEGNEYLLGIAKDVED